MQPNGVICAGIIAIEGLDKPVAAQFLAPVALIAYRAYALTCITSAKVEAYNVSARVFFTGHVSNSSKEGNSEYGGK